MEILQADGVLNGNTITCKFEGNTYSGTYDNPNNLDFSCCFPVQHTHGQNLQISVSNGENLIGAVNKSVEDIVANEKSLNWYVVPVCNIQIFSYLQGGNDLFLI